MIVKPYETDETIVADYPLHAPRKGLGEREEVWILRSGSPTHYHKKWTNGWGQVTRTAHPERIRRHRR